MKHLLNDMSEAEKNAIREQHLGGMKIANEKFSKLVGSKLGDVKPFLTEQKQTPPFTKGQKFSAMRSVDNKKYSIEIVDVQPGYLTAKIIGDGTYEGQPLDGKYPKELTYQDGKLMGNMQMGNFTIIPEKSSKLGETNLDEQAELNIDPKDLELPNEDMLRKIFTGEEDFAKHFGKSPEGFKKVMQACISERDLYKVEALVKNSETKKMDVLKTIMAMVMDRGLGGRTIFQEFNELGKCVNEKLGGKLDGMMK